MKGLLFGILFFAETLVLKADEGLGLIEKSAFPVSEIVRSEETILELTPQLKRLTASLLAPEEVENSPVFDEEFLVANFPENRLVLEKSENPGVFVPLVLQSNQRAVQKIPYLPLLESWSAAQFGVLEGRFHAESDSVFTIKCSFEGAGVLAGKRVAVTGHQELIWKKKEDVWLLSHWEQKSLNFAWSPQLLFTEVLDEMIADPKLQKELRRSWHEEYLIASFKRGYQIFLMPRTAQFLLEFRISDHLIQYFRK